MGEKAKVEDYIGKKYNELTILGNAGTKDGRTLVKCRCDCGNEIVRPLIIVKNGNTKSCGCRQKRVLRERNYKHGNATRGTKDRLYAVWCGMRKRCSENASGSDYEEYYARGIKVCPEWQGYSAFREWAYANGYDENAAHSLCTLDRIDVNGNYEPGNCRWVPNSVQQNNKRNNIRIEYEGETHTLAEWSRLKGISYGTLQTRYHQGYRGNDLFSKRNLQTGRQISEGNGLCRMTN